MDVRVWMGPRRRSSIVAWMLVFVAIGCVVALVNWALLTWSAQPNGRAPISLAGGSAPSFSAAAPGSEVGSRSTESVRIPIRVLMRRVGSGAGCDGGGRVPIRMMVRCHRDDSAAIPDPTGPGNGTGMRSARASGHTASGE